MQCGKRWYVSQCCHTSVLITFQMIPNLKIAPFITISMVFVIIQFTGDNLLNNTLHHTIRDLQSHPSTPFNNTLWRQQTACMGRYSYFYLFLVVIVHVIFLLTLCQMKMNSGKRTKLQTFWKKVLPHVHRNQTSHRFAQKEISKKKTFSSATFLNDSQKKIQC